MRLLLDECTPRILRTALADVGYDVARSKLAQDDIGVLRQAHREGRILVTFDIGFGKLVLRDEILCYGVVILDESAIKDDSSSVFRLAEEMKSLGDELEGQLTSFRNNKLRMRALPLAAKPKD